MRYALHVFRAQGWRGLSRRILQVIDRGLLGLVGRLDYAHWVRRYDTLGGSDRRRLEQRASGFSGPLISVILPICSASAPLLREAVQSVTDQIYRNWELCIAAGASVGPEVRSMLEEVSRTDSRVTSMPVAAMQATWTARCSFRTSPP